MTKHPRIAKAQGRSVQEWVGKTADSVPPPTVRARIFDRDKGICHITGAKILPGDEWHLDHRKRLEDGGENRESNLAPALAAPHREKTAEETRRGKKADRQRRAHIGAKSAPAKPIQSASFRPAPPQRKASKPPAAGSKLEQLRALGSGEIARRYGAKGG
jgi:5-methylcytosine-specific restriction protein A